MNEHDRQEKPGVTPRQMTLMAVLGVIFVAVIVMQWGGSSEPASAPGKRSPGRVGRRGAAPPPATLASAPLAPRQRQPWPEIPLAEVLRYNPFRTFAALAPVAPEVPAIADSNDAPQIAPPSVDTEQSRQRAQSVLGGLTPGIVYTSTDREFVSLGNRIVRVGDQLEGYRVVKITPAGIVLEEMRN